MILAAINHVPVEVGLVGSPFNFTGEQLDDNGLLYLRARYYSPELGVFTGLDPVEFVNRYQYVSANPINRVDPSGLRPCDGPDSEGCLDKIEGRLRNNYHDKLFAAGLTLGYMGFPNLVGDLIGGVSIGLGEAENEASSGFMLAARLIDHYLEEDGEPFIVFPAQISKRMHSAIANRMTDLLIQDHFNDICTRNGNTSGEIDDVGFGPSGNPNSLLRAESTMQDPWWINRLEDAGINVIPLRPEGSQNQIWRPHYIAFGGFTITQNEQAYFSTQQVGSTWITNLNTIVDFYDHYDWCFGDNPCESCGTHPAGMRVGHFAALELAGRAKQFEIFGRWGVSLRLQISCTSGTPIVDDIDYNWHSVDRPASFPSRPQYTKDMRYVSEGGIVIDDWSNCCAGDFSNSC